MTQKIKLKKIKIKLKWTKKKSQINKKDLPQSGWLKKTQGLRPRIPCAVLCSRLKMPEVSGICQKRPICLWKEIYIYIKRPSCTHHLQRWKELFCQTRPICLWKETYIYKRPYGIHHIQKRHTCGYLKMFEVHRICHKRRIYMKRVLSIWKETWKKTHLYKKRPIHMKRDPFI